MKKQKIQGRKGVGHGLWGPNKQTKKKKEKTEKNLGWKKAVQLTLLYGYLGGRMQTTTKGECSTKLLQGGMQRPSAPF